MKNKFKKVLALTAMVLAVGIPVANAEPTPVHVYKNTNKDFYVYTDTFVLPKVQVGDKISLTGFANAGNNYPGAVVTVTGVSANRIDFTVPTSWVTFASGEFYGWSDTTVDTVSPANSAIEVFSTVKDWLLGSLLPKIAGFVLLVISIRLSISAVRKYSRGLK